MSIESAENMTCHANISEHQLQRGSSSGRISTLQKVGNKGHLHEEPETFRRAKSPSEDEGEHGVVIIITEDTSSGLR